MMKPNLIEPLFVAVLLAGGVATLSSHAAPVSVTNTSASHAQALHFARGATKLSLSGNIKGSQHRFYTLRMNAGQHLKISAQSDAKTKSGLVPLIFVTPPCGEFNGDKTAIYTEDSSRKGDYRIEVAPNQMASTANHGAFVLHVEAY